MKVRPKLRQLGDVPESAVTLVTCQSCEPNYAAFSSGGTECKGEFTCAKSPYSPPPSLCWS